MAFFIPCLNRREPLPFEVKFHGSSNVPALSIHNCFNWYSGHVPKGM